MGYSDFSCCIHYALVLWLDKLISHLHYYAQISQFPRLLLLESKWTMELIQTFLGDELIKPA